MDDFIALVGFVALWLNVSVAGVAVSLLGPVIWLRDSHLGRFSPVRSPDSHRPYRIWARFVWIGVLLLAPILVLLLVNALRVPNCALDHGLAFFGLIAVGSAAVSSLWALLAIVLSPSKVWLRWVVYLAFWILSALVLMVAVWVEPRKPPTVTIPSERLELEERWAEHVKGAGRVVVKGGT